MRITSSAFVAITLLSAMGVARTIPPADTQAGMNASADHKLKVAEAEMNALLNRLNTKAAGRPQAITLLGKAQESWQNYRDAQLKAMWPSLNDNAYGSVYPMCVAAERARLTESRIAELRAMLDPIEGNVCGSQWPE